MTTATRTPTGAHAFLHPRGIPLIALLGLAVAGCADGPANPHLSNAPIPSAAVIDGRHPDGTPGFYFLPPLADAPSFSGVFDPSQPAVVELCPGATGTPGCDGALATFERVASGGPNRGIVVGDDAYHVNLRAGAAGAATLVPYRIRVRVESQVLGELDLMFFDGGRERSRIDQDRFAAVPIGGVVPVRFRIEEGAVRDDQPDLLIASVAAAPDPVPLGQTFQATIAVANGGAGAAGAFDVLFWTETSAGDPVGAPVRQRVETGIDAGGSATVVMTGPEAMGLPDPSLRLHVEVDPDGEVAEIDEGNNAARTTLTVALPDLAVTALGAPAALLEGEPAGITVTIHNGTAVDAPISTVRVRLLNGNGDVVAEASSDLVVPAGAVVEGALPITAPLDGEDASLTLEAVADAGDVVPEVDETNNRAAVSVPVNPAVPDLTVRSVTADAALTLGVPASVVVELGNDGFVPVSDVSYLLEVLDGAGSVVAGLGTFLVAGEIAPEGGVASHTVEVLPDASWGGAGAYSFRASADPAGAVAELDEANNVGSSGPSQLGAPDLAVGTPAVPAAVQPGATVTVTAPIDNLGDRDAGAFTAVWRVSDGGVEVHAWSEPHAGLAAGASGSLSASFVVAGEWEGPLSVAVEVGGIPELETGNNQASAGPIEIQRIDMAALTAPAHPDALVLACTVPVAATVGNLGNGDAGESVTRFRLLSADGLTEVATRDVATPAIPSGGSVEVQAAFVVGGSWPEEVQVQVIANADAAIEERDRDNNLSSSQATPAVVRVVPPAGFTRLWICGSSDGWSDASNWQPAGVPTTGDEVYVPAGVATPTGDPRYPRLAAAVRVSGLTIEDGAAVHLSGFNLTVTGSLVSSRIEGPGMVVLDGAEGRGRIPNLWVANANSLSGDLTVDGNVTIPFDDHNLLDIRGHTLSVGGRFDLQYHSNLSAGSLRMTVPGSTIDAAGDVILHLNNTDMSEGTIHVGGNFAQPRGSQNGGSIILDGTAPQTAWWTHLTNLTVAEGADVTVVANSHMRGRLTVRGRIFQDAAVGQVAFTGLLPRVLGGSYEVARSVVTGTVRLDEDVTLAHPAAGVIVPVRTENLLDINGHELFLGGRFDMHYDSNLGSGSLRMTVPGSEIEAEGDVVLHLGRTDMPEGTIRVGGNFAQPRGGQDGGVIIFDGTAPQSASWTHLTNVIVAAGADVTVNAPSRMFGRLTVQGRIYQSSAVGHVAYTGRLPRVLGGSYEVENSVITGTVVLDEDVILAHPSANVTLPYNRNNVLDLNGHQLFVGGSFHQQYHSNLGAGTLRMMVAGSEIEAERDVVLHTNAADMLEGVIRVGGNFAQPRGAANGVAVIFDGAAPQSASWANLGDVTVASGADVTVTATSHVSGRLTVDGRIYQDGAVGHIQYGRHLPRVLGGSYEVGHTLVLGHIVLDEDVTLPYPDGRLTVYYRSTNILDLNGHRLFVGGHMSVLYRTNYGAGRLLLNVAGSELEVDGNLGMDMRASDFNGGRIIVGGHLSQSWGSFAGSEVVFDGTAPQAPSLARVLHHVGIDNPAGVSLPGSQITGQLRSTAGVSGLLTGSGAGLLVRGIAAADLTLDNRPLVTDGGQLGEVSGLTFRNMAPTVTQLTVRHPGTADPLVWTGLAFETAPTSGLYIRAEDHVADGNDLTIELRDAVAVNGPTYTSTAGAASVTWQ